MGYWLKIDGALHGRQNPDGMIQGFESIEDLAKAFWPYGYERISSSSNGFCLRVSGVVRGVAEVVELPPLRDMFEVPRK